MRRFFQRRDVASFAAVIAAVALTFAFSLCAFDRDGNGVDDEGMDMCAMPLAITAGTILLVGPAVAGWIIGEILSSAPEASAHLPDPPPKSALTV